ncbi:MAG: pyruvate kinase [Candidatus Thorarchaeota archaeon]|nr:pyruvate kinase [Candidatus Thorarchaeota archaeon]
MAIEKRNRTKIVCTIGPASRSGETLARMIEAGMDVARLNLSHDTHAIHRKTFETIRSVDDSIPILFDIQGPKIRIGDMKKAVELQTGDSFTLSIKDFVGNRERASISHKDLPRDVKPGDVIAINDGIVRLRVKEIDDDEVRTEITHGGPISSRKGVNVPGIRLSCGVPTEKDLKDLDLAAELEPDLIAISFVVDENDVRRVNKILKSNGPKNVDVISKIEHTLAVKNYPAILEESHGVMIARGDLGIEVPIEEVPILQRDLIREANMWARAAIVATHMLESMIHEQMPTRAEVSDVAHAVFDRADAVMLSGETAIGHDPVGAIEMMKRVAGRAEKRITPIKPDDITSPKKLIVEVIGSLVYNTVALLPDKIGGVITATRSGFTARWISKFRPPTNIYAVTNDPAVVRRLRLWWGVYPVKYDQDIQSVDDLVMEAVCAAHERELISIDKDVVFTSGVRHIPGKTNVVGVFHVRDLVQLPKSRY